MAVTLSLSRRKLHFICRNVSCAKVTRIIISATNVNLMAQQEKADSSHTWRKGEGSCRKQHLSLHWLEKKSPPLTVTKIVIPDTIREDLLEQWHSCHKAAMTWDRNTSFLQTKLKTTAAEQYPWMSEPFDSRLSNGILSFRDSAGIHMPWA